MLVDYHCEKGKRMKIQKFIRAMIFVLFVLGWTIFFLAAFSSVNADDNQGETGSVSGKIKVFRARHAGDVVVFLEGESLKKEYSSPEKHGVVDQKNLKFFPHVLPILKGTTVDFHNSDDVQHNIFSPGKTEKFNLGTWGLGGARSYAFNKPGEVIILCNVHSDMLAYIIILENPYFALTDTEGNFRIENIPAGTYTLETWHERMKSDPQEITIGKGDTKEINLELKKRK